MNKIKYSIVVLLSCLLMTGGLTSCNKFLTLTPTGKKFVNSIDDLRDMMGSYMILLTDPDCPQINIFAQNSFVHPYFDTSILAMMGNELELRTDNNQYFNNSSRKLTGDGRALLSARMDMDQMWEPYYQTAGALNYILIETEQLKSDSKVTHDMVRGEALVWRAFCYYKLLQYYAPYKEASQGIPISLNPVKNVEKIFPKRQPQMIVYKRIIDDCQEALQLLKQTPTQNWNVAYRADFIHAMLADIYAYKSGSGAAEATDWQKSYENALAAAKGRQLSSSEVALRSLFDCSYDALTSGLTAAARDEYFIRIRSSYLNGLNLLKFKNNYFEGITTGFITPAYKPFFEDQEDVRVKAFVTFDNDELKYNKYNYVPGFKTHDNGGVLMPFRLADVVLLQAEALIQMGKLTEGATVLRSFIHARRPMDLKPLPADKEGLLNLLYKERKVEFFCEYDVNWLDMKRHEEGFTRTFNGEAFKIMPNDSRYTFLIPIGAEINLNPNLTQNR